MLLAGAALVGSWIAVPVRAADNPVMVADKDAKITALERRLNALEESLRAQQDIEEIRTLQYTYGYYMDNQLYGQVVSLWSKHPVSAEIGGSGVFKGQEGILRRYGEGKDVGPTFGLLREHFQLQDVIHIAPDRKSAKGRFRALAFWSLKLGDPAGQQIQVGLYENEYVREDGVWKISKIDYKQVFTAPYLKGWSAEPLYSSCALPGADAPTSWYHPYPEMGVFAFHYPNPVTGKPVPQLNAPTHHWKGNWPEEFGQCGDRSAPAP